VISTRTALPWLVLIALTAAALSRSLGGGATGPPGELAVKPGEHLTARVLRVVDGDTVKVQADGGTATVRYIGMDTPESVKPNTPVQCFAKAASHRNEELVGGRNVNLVVGAEPRDRYGRLLAYVYVGPARLLVNGELLREGYARTLTIAPNDDLAGRFAELQSEAQTAGRGLWTHC
jgi:micrococcal nuclease